MRLASCLLTVMAISAAASDVEVGSPEFGSLSFPFGN